VQTAESPEEVAVISRGAPHRLQGGPEGDSACVDRWFATVRSSARPTDPRPGSTIPSNRVKECPQLAQEPVSTWAGWLANSIAVPQSGHVLDTGYRPSRADEPSLGGLSELDGLDGSSRSHLCLGNRTSP
jgi:hypothetical protein